MSWFGRSPRARGTSLADRPTLLGESLVGDQQPAVELSGDDLVARLERGSRVSGQLSFNGAARIDGSVDGEIRCRGNLTIGEGAEIRANISAAAVVINGRVEGDVTAEEKVELGVPARLSGNIDAPRLVVAEGVVFDGDCTMGGGARGAAADRLTANEVFEGGSPKLVTNLEK